MKQKSLTRVILCVLVLCLMMGNLGLMPALAAGNSSSVADDPSLYVDSYADFVKELKVLEDYADSYLNTQSKYKDAGELIVNFIRTGVERYNESLWPQLAGQEITGFVNYVKAQDQTKGTTAMRLRDIKEFKLPNGDTVDFGHMFGTLNIAYIAVIQSADLGGWAGDICDLLNYSFYFGDVPAGTVDEQAAYILDHCFGVDADNAFGMDDFYGDMDAFYLIKQMKAGETLSSVMEAYFTPDLDDGDRSAFFLNNRFKGLKTKEDVRNAVYEAYVSNDGLSVLEADRGISGQADLRKACCYAFADYVYAQGGDRLTGEGGGEEPENPGEEPKPEEPVVPDNPYYSVFSSATSILAPGITQTIKYATTTDGKQIVYYIATVDVNREDVTIMANYKDADPSKGWGMQRVLDQAEALDALHSNPDDPANYIPNFQPVVAINADGYNMDTGKPGGLLVMGGVEWHPVDGDGFFAILSDGRAMIGTKADYEIYKDQIKEAIGGFGSTLVLNGEIAVSASSNYYVTRASRTAIGITATGEVVMMVLDGRQEPFSAGGSMEEIAQIMLDAGCVHAINLDGGGSSTFVAKPEGTEQLIVVSSPSDGYPRSVAASLVAVSTAVVSNEFEYASISADYDYVTIGTELKLTATGVSISGHSAEIPSNAVWQLSDNSMGTVQGGVFIATQNGEVDVQMVVDGKVVGSKKLHVVLPDKVAFEDDALNVIYGVPTEAPVNCYYQGNLVAFNLNDILMYPEDDFAATVDGITLTGNEAYGMRVVTIWVELCEDFEIYDEMVITMFKADEAIFDFDNAIGGDKTLAWDREVTNATVIDGLTFQVLNTNEGMDISYVFALDMKAIKIPEKLQGIVYMLPGGDNVNASAWDFLMQLAERVSVLSEVRVTAQFDKDLDVDVSQLRIANDYFYQKSVTLDKETNTVTLVCGWIDQTQALDPATANSLCILSGITAKPKSDAAWDGEDQLDIVVSGQVSYDIYLRANALYSFALIEENQEKYGLVPFDNQDIIINGATEKGAHFADTYAVFEDHFILDSTNRQGWVNYDSCLYYFVDNVAVTGMQLLPGYNDPDNKYLYQFTEDGACEGVVTGLVNMDGGLYYFAAGQMKTGWQVIMDKGVKKYYFFNTWSGRALNGTQTIGGYTYVFTDYVLTRGTVVTNATGTRYMWAGSWVTQEWIELDGKMYYARSSGYFETGLTYRYSPEGDWTYYAFDENGAWMTDYYGIYEYKGGTYLIKYGYVIDYPGVFELDGKLYYISSTNVMVKNGRYWVSKTNGLVPEGSYYFDANGVMQYTPANPDTPDNPDNPDTPDTPVVPEPPVQVKNGIVAEEGSLFYYVEGVRTYAGLIEIDGNYYYVRTSGELAHDVWYWPTKTNGLMVTDRRYYFDANGVMQDHPFGSDEEPSVPDTPDEPDTPENPEVLNGIVQEGDNYYYYVDGARVHAGLIKDGEYYYYARSDGSLVVNCKYWVSKTNDLLEEGIYTFDAKGRIVFETVELKNGIVAENDSLWYYVDGKLNYAGLIEIEGNYYYVRTSGEVVRGQWYWPTKTNDLMATDRRYYFDENGVMVGHNLGGNTDPDEPIETLKNGIVAEDGSLFYYVNGVRTYAGLIEIDGKYYYVRTSGELAHDVWYWPTKTNDMMETTKRYYFDANGVMQDAPVMNNSAN